MKARNLLLSLSLFLATCIISLANPAAAADGYDRLTDEFFARIAEGKYSEAVDSLFAKNKWTEKTPDAIMKLKQYFSGIEDQLGKYRSHELLVKEILSDKFVLLMYFIVYDRQPMAFEFQYYRSENEWNTQNFIVSDSPEDMIKEKAMARYRRPQ
jgi:hypothetical protein